MSHENVLRRLQEFAINNGRLPKIDDLVMEEVIKAAKKEFGSLENALIIAGLLPESRAERSETLTGVIMRLLDCSPMTLAQLREEVRKVPGFASASAEVIAHAVYTSTHMKSIGPRRQKVYFIEGQEELALARRGENLTHARSLLSTTDAKDDIYERLTSPMTTDQLERLLSERGDQPNRTRIQSMLNKLLEAELIRRVRFIAGARGSKKYSAYELFGCLACKTYFYRTDSPEAIINLVSRSLDPKRIEDRGFRLSLTMHLRQILPKDVMSVWRSAFTGIGCEEIATQDMAAVNQTEPFTDNNEIRINCYCYGGRTHVRVIGNPIGIVGSELIRVAACENANCLSPNSSDCLIGKIRHIRRYLK
jgi:hypothetical protein